MKHREIAREPYSSWVMCSPKSVRKDRRFVPINADVSRRDFGFTPTLVSNEIRSGNVVWAVSASQ